MMKRLRKMGRKALRDGLAADLEGVDWGSPEMAESVNMYLLDVCRHTGMAILVKLSPLSDMGLDVNDGTTAAAQLAALQSLNGEEFAGIVEDAWKDANGEKPPEGAGYQHFLGEVTLETLRRLKPRKK